MDEGRLEDILREGPPFATAYVARPIVLDDAPARRDAPTARRVVLVMVTVGLLLGAAVAALAVVGFLRPSDPGPLALIRGGALFVVPTDGSPDRGDPAERPGWARRLVSARAVRPTGDVRVAEPSGRVARRWTHHPQGEPRANG